MDNLGFIILRHVNNLQTSKYYKFAYDCIRRFYPETPIVIIDDNSNYSFIDQSIDRSLHKTTIIQSEYKGRGELLPFYYFSKTRFFDTAVIMHDSTFITKHINFEAHKCRFIWEFYHTWDKDEDEIKLLGHLNHSESLTDFYKIKTLWNGCFGGMVIIKHSFLKELDDIHCIGNLLNVVTSKSDRMALERVLGCLFQYYSKEESLFGFIHQYVTWCTPEHRDINQQMIDDAKLPIIKIWNNR